MFVVFSKMWVFGWTLTATLFGLASANENAKRLYDDLMINYNKLRRPVERPKEVLTIFLKLKLSQIIDVVSYSAVVSDSIFI